MWLHVMNIRLYKMVSSEKFNAPKLVNGSENRCSFVFDKKYDELRWFRLTRVTAYGMNVFRRFVKYLPGTKPAKRAFANLHLNFPVENIDNRDGKPCKSRTVGASRGPASR